MSEATNGTSFASLFTSYQVLCHTPLTDRDMLIREMVNALGPALEPSQLEDAVRLAIERENQMPSVVGPGIALPHARIRGLPRLVVAVATSQEGIPFSPEPDGLVKLIILVLTPHDTPGAYLQAVSSLATMLQAPGTADQIAEVVPASLVFDEQDEMKEGIRFMFDADCQFSAQDRLDLVFVRGANEAHRAVNGVVIGQGEGGHA